MKTGVVDVGGGLRGIYAVVIPEGTAKPSF